MDLISKVHFSNTNAEYVDALYGALSAPHTEALFSLKQLELSEKEAELTAQRLKVTSPWLVAVRAADPRSSAVVASALRAYLTHWLRLHRRALERPSALWLGDAPSIPFYGGTAAELWEEEQEVRSLLFSRQSWGFLDLVLGRPQGVAVRDLLRNRHELCSEASPLGIRPHDGRSRDDADLRRPPASPARLRTRTLPPGAVSMLRSLGQRAAPSVDAPGANASSVEAARTARACAASRSACAAFRLRDAARRPAADVRLDVSKRGLLKLDLSPARAASLEQLQELFLCNSRIRTLPWSLSRLTRLVTLSLDYNELVELPACVCALERLERLGLCQNVLRAVSAEVGQLRALQTLALQHNALSQLPDTFGELQSLTDLSLTHNRLLSAEFLPRLTNLQKLGLSHNKLRTLPDGFGRTRRLQSVGLAHNRLTSLPPSLVAAPSLQLLCASHNAIRALPPSIGAADALAWLDLQHNAIRALPPSLLALDSLRVVLLQGNPLPDSTLSAAAASTSALRAELRRMTHGVSAASALQLVVRAVGNGDADGLARALLLSRRNGAAHEAAHGADGADGAAIEASAAHATSVPATAAAAASVSAGQRFFRTALSAQAARLDYARIRSGAVAAIACSLNVWVDGACTAGADAAELHAHARRLAEPFLCSPDPSRSITLLVAALKDDDCEARVQAALSEIHALSGPSIGGALPSAAGALPALPAPRRIVIVALCGAELTRGQVDFDADALTERWAALFTSLQLHVALLVNPAWSGLSSDALSVVHSTISDCAFHLLCALPPEPRLAHFAREQLRVGSLAPSLSWEALCARAACEWAVGASRRSELCAAIRLLEASGDVVCSPPRGTQPPHWVACAPACFFAHLSLAAHVATRPVGRDAAQRGLVRAEDLAAAPSLPAAVLPALAAAGVCVPLSVIGAERQAAARVAEVHSSDEDDTDDDEWEQHEQQRVVGDTCGARDASAESRNGWALLPLLDRRDGEPLPSPSGVDAAQEPALAGVWVSHARMQQAASEAQPIGARVLRFQLASRGGRDRHVVYQVVVQQSGGATHTVRRRYSHFRRLHAALTQRYGAACALQQLPVDLLSMLRNPGADALRKRAELLDAYLRELLRSPLLRDSALVRRFFDLAARGRNFVHNFPLWLFNRVQARLLQTLPLPTSARRRRQCFQVGSRSLAYESMHFSLAVKLLDRRLPCAGAGERPVDALALLVAVFAFEPQPWVTEILQVVRSVCHNACPTLPLQETVASQKEMHGMKPMQSRRS